MTRVATEMHHDREAERTVLEMDYVHVLRRSREAFEGGDASEGLRLLDMAATYERHLAAERPDVTRRAAS